MDDIFGGTSNTNLRIIIAPHTYDICHLKCEGLKMILECIISEPQFMQYLCCFLIKLISNLQKKKTRMRNLVFQFKTEDIRIESSIHQI